MTTEAACERCGVFLPAGTVRWCDACGKRRQAELEVRRTARLMAACLALAGAVLTSIVIAAMVKGRSSLDPWGMLAFTAQSAGAPFAGAVLVLLRRRPAAGWVATAIMMASPVNWAFLTLGPRAITLWGRISILALLAAFLGVAVGFKLRRQANALKG